MIPGMFRLIMHLVFVSMIFLQVVTSAPLTATTLLAQQVHHLQAGHHNLVN